MNFPDNLVPDPYLPDLPDPLADLDLPDAETTQPINDPRIDGYFTIRLLAKKTGIHLSISNQTIKLYCRGSLMLETESKDAATMYLKGFLDRHEMKVYRRKVSP